jgi:hypothetical protein
MGWLPPVGDEHRALADWLQDRAAAGGEPVRVEGLDLSPQMLAVARVRDENGRIAAWHHAAAEATGLPAASFDLMTLQIRVPQASGRRLPAPIGTLLKSTESYLEDYFRLDMAATLG